MAGGKIMIVFVLALILLLVVIVEAVIYEIFVFPKFRGYDNLFQELKDKKKKMFEKLKKKRAEKVSRRYADICVKHFNNFAKEYEEWTFNNRKNFDCSESDILCLQLFVWDGFLSSVRLCKRITENSGSDMDFMREAKNDMPQWIKDKNKEYMMNHGIEIEEK